MRRQFLVMTAMLAIVGFSGATVADSASGTEYVGSWPGKWEGEGGSGRFDLTLTKEADGKISGGVSVGSDTGDYIAKFKSLSIEGNKLTAKYDFPPQAGAEISVTATFDGGKATGTWGLGQTGGEAMATGTWNVAKK